MSSVAEDNEGPIILTGPNEEALHEFSNTLMRVASPEIKKRDRERRVLSGQELLRGKIDFSRAKCFLVMPRANRTLVYIQGDRSSMYREIEHMCSTCNQEGNKRGKSLNYLWCKNWLVN